MADAIVLAGVIAAVCGALVVLVRNRKRGNPCDGCSACGKQGGPGGCGGCSGWDR